MPTSHTIRSLFLVALFGLFVSIAPAQNAPVIPTPIVVPGPTAPLSATTGAGMLSIAQSGEGWGPGNREGALFFFRIEKSGILQDEKRLEASPLAFSLAPGRYELKGYSRGCDGNCNRLGSPMVECSIPFSLAAGEVLYAERILQKATCTIRLNAAPKR